MIERHIAKVYIGALDRNPTIRGNGEIMMIDAGVKIARFDSDLIPVLEELNREFIRQYRGGLMERTETGKKDPVELDTQDYYVHQECGYGIIVRYKGKWACKHCGKTADSIEEFDPVDNCY